MANLLILLTCLVGLAAAGVIDTRWMRGGGLDERYGSIGYNNFENDFRVGRQISRMTDDELFRQKVLLKLLDRVQYTLNDVDLLHNVMDEFNTNEGNYDKGFDADMLYVIELQRNGQLLGKRDVFCMLDKDQRRQMIGLKRLLTRAIDFETFVQNAVTARNCMNGVLFVNAMLLAVRERKDTCQLIVPAIYDILPELYIDGETLRKIGNIDMNLLTRSTGFETMRPTLMNLIGGGGLGGVYGLNGRFNQLGNLVTRNRYSMDVEDKIVIDEVNKDTKDRSLKLLTDDVGFKAFMQNLFNDLCLKENEIEKETKMGIYGNGLLGLDNGNKFGLYGNTNMLGGRKFNTFGYGNTRDRFMDLMMRRGINDGRRTKYTNVLDDLNRFGTVGVNRFDTFGDKRRGMFNDDLNRFGTVGGNRFDTFGDKRRGMLNDDLNRFGTIGGNRFNTFGDKRRGMLNDDLNRFGTFGVNRFDTFGVNRFDTFGDKRQFMGMNDLGVGMSMLGDRKKSTNSEVLLHNLKQILSRIILERISLGLDTTDDLVMVNDFNKQLNSFLNLNDYRINTNAFGNRGMNDVDVERFIDILQQKIVRKLQNGLFDERMMTQDYQVDRLIARSLLDRMDGDVNLLDILIEVMMKNVGFGLGGDMQIVRNLDDILKDKRVISMLFKIMRTIDITRTKILGSYKRNDIEFDDVKINNIIVDDLITRRKQKDIDVTNLMDVQTNDKVIVVRQKQLTNNDFDIKIDVDSKRQQRVVVRTFIGPKGRGDLNLNERRLGFMLLDTFVTDLVTGRNVIQRNSLELLWTKRGTTTLNKIYKRIMGVNLDDGITIGQDCRFPQNLILPRGRVDGLDLELFVVITPYEGVGDMMTLGDDIGKKCTMGMSVKGVDTKSLGFPLDRVMEFDIRMLNNVGGIDIKIFDDERKGMDFNLFNLW